MRYHIGNVLAMQVTRSRPLHIAAALAGGLLVVALFAIACSDASSDSAASDPPAALSERAAAATPSPAVTKVSAVPLQRYRYTVTLSLEEARRDGGDVVITTEGRYQADDRHAFTYTVRIDGETIAEQRAVLIGGRAWLQDGDKAWRELRRAAPQVADLLNVAFSPVRPDFLGGPAFEQLQQNVQGLPSTEQAINGVPANGYTVGPDGQAFFETFVAQKQLPAAVDEIQWRVWLAKDGAWPVRLRAATTIVKDIGVLEELDLKAPTRWELRVDISHPNDPAVAVRPPAGER